MTSAGSPADSSLDGVDRPDPRVAATIDSLTAEARRRWGEERAAELAERLPDLARAMHLVETMTSGAIRAEFVDQDNVE